MQYIAGTDPMLKTSRFAVKSLTHAEDGFVVSWNAVEGRVYDIYWTPSLSREFVLLESGITYPQDSYLDTEYSSKPSGYYMVKVRLLGGDDVDGDGLPDIWESEFFPSSVAAVAGYDSDGDGQSNIQEYYAGTNPTNVTSVFRVSLDMSNLFVPDGGMIVEWNAVEGRYYNVLWAPDLQSSFIAIKNDIYYPQSSYTDTVHRVEQGGFYKVDVHLQ